MVTIATHEGEPLYVELPASVVLEVTYTEPGLQGDRSSAGTKPATLETGYEIQVPLFLEQGTKVKVDTRTGDYLGRVDRLGGSEPAVSARSKSRKRALDILYGADVRGVPIATLLDEESDARRGRSRSASRRGATPARSSRASTSTCSSSTRRSSGTREGWTLERMPVLDRAIVRIGAWEILYNDEVPDGVAIAEAVESATVLSTEDSGGFINGAARRDRARARLSSHGSRHATQYFVV